MKKGLRILMVAALAAVALVAISGCTGKVGGIEVEGTWHWTNGTWESKYVITQDTVEVHGSYASTEPSYTYTIVDFDNRAFNADEEETSDCGFAVLEYKDAPAWNPDASGFIILRWKNLDASGDVTLVDLAEGYNADGTSETAEAAETEYTSADGSFAMYSEECELQASE